MPEDDEDQAEGFETAGERWAREPDIEEHEAPEPPTPEGEDDGQPHEGSH